MRGLSTPRYVHGLPAHAAQVPGWTLVSLPDAQPETCGAKAATCGELEALGKSSGLFATPRGVVVPFGSMELAVKVSLTGSQVLPMADRSNSNVLM